MDKTDIQEIETLLCNPALSRVEQEIATLAGCDLSKESLPLLLDFMQQEIASSMLQLHVIEKFIENHPDVVIEFGRTLLVNYQPEALSIGIAITYTIYLIYLKSKTKKELLEYIQRRRIPKARQFVKELFAVRQAMTIVF